MEDIKSKEKQLYLKWAQKLQIEDFCPNGGLLFRGNFHLNEPNDNKRYTWYRDSGDENIRWCNSCKRLMILTKDLNDDEMWDIRQESGGRAQMSENRIPPEEEIRYMGYSFYRRLNRWVFGILKENQGCYPQFEEIKDKYNMLGHFYENAPLVRINCKYELGGSSVKDNILEEEMMRNKELLVEQFKLYKANIILCCGNQILNFVKQYCFKGLNVIDDTNNRVYYSAEDNVIVINSYHPSVRGRGLNDKWLYEEFMKNIAIGFSKYKNIFKPLLS